MLYKPPMRVTSDFFVSALVRRIFGEGGFAAVSRRGAQEAGAVFVVVDRLDGTFDFYAPAPQALMDGPALERQFERTDTATDRPRIDARLASEARMDPDFWVVEIEARDGRVELPTVKEAPEDDGFFRR